VAGRDWRSVAGEPRPADGDLQRPDLYRARAIFFRHCEERSDTVLCGQYRAKQSLPRKLEIASLRFALGTAKSAVRNDELGSCFLDEKTLTHLYDATRYLTKCGDPVKVCLVERMDKPSQTLSSGMTSGHRLLMWLVGLALAAAFLYTFAELAGDVQAGEGFVFDRLVMEALHRLASPWLTAIMWAITATGSAVVAAGVTAGLGIHWWRKAGQRAEARVLMITMAASAALGQILKLLFARSRPDLFPWLTRAGGWSFPSGHTLTVVTLGGLLAWLKGRRLSGWRRAALWIVVGLWVGLVSLSRVYLGVHYPSDVLASLAVGGLCLLVAMYVYRPSVLD